MSSKRRKDPLFELGQYWLDRDHGTETIYRFWYDPHSQRVRRRSTGTGDIERAKADLAQLIGERSEYEPQAPENVFISQVLDHYWLTHSDATPGHFQARRAGCILIDWLVRIQERPSATVSDFSVAWQHAFIRYCAGDLEHAVGTISRNMKMISAAFNHAVKPVVVEEDGAQRVVQILKYAPPIVYQQGDISKLTGKPESAPRDWLPTWEQLAMFIDGIGHKTASGAWDEPSENLFRYVVVALNTWARPEAILQLTVSKQVNFEAGILALNPPGRRQNKKHRPAIPLTDNLRHWLKEWDDDRPVPVKSIKSVFGRHADKMGMPLFTPYTLRHFMATNVRGFQGAQVSREDRQEWLGHKRRDTTSWYEHHDPEWLSAAKLATDSIVVRIDGVLKKRTITSRIPPETQETTWNGLKLVVSK